ncbi:hypothetical protein Rsub_12644 [Raphidocelis subcapitata]|uniref:Uncharacterized protein n=1 Tax=Raphidocelis subcapitata TaxID=307507 RepID=A0A2V0PJH3_9CHLO|nr:hypothetical protein Rsub_12644 [Raphidocelis subcapitata]|eukprot:GBF99951.1 hypothetical protein Rsub_12644 [Raphidocelis subcapitata]
MAPAGPAGSPKFSQRLAYLLATCENADAADRAADAARELLLALGCSQARGALLDVLKGLDTCSKRAARLRLQLAADVLPRLDAQQLVAFAPWLVKQALQCLSTHCRHDAACTAALAELVAGLGARLAEDGEGSDAGAVVDAAGGGPWLFEELLLPLVRSSYRDPEPRRVAAGCAVLEALVAALAGAAGAPRVAVALRAGLAAALEHMWGGSAARRVSAAYAPLRRWAGAVGPARLGAEGARRLAAICCRGAADRDAWQVRREALQTLAALLTMVQADAEPPAPAPEPSNGAVEGVPERTARQASTSSGALEALTALRQRLLDALEGCRHDTVAAVREAAAEARSAAAAMAGRRTSSDPGGWGFSCGGASSWRGTSGGGGGAFNGRGTSGGGALSGRGTSGGGGGWPSPGPPSPQRTRRSPLKTPIAVRTSGVVTSSATGYAAAHRFHRPAPPENGVLDFGIQVFAPPSPTRAQPSAGGASAASPGRPSDSGHLRSSIDAASQTGGGGGEEALGAALPQWSYGGAEGWGAATSSAGGATAVVDEVVARALRSSLPSSVVQQQQQQQQRQQPAEAIPPASRQLSRAPSGLGEALAAVRRASSRVDGLLQELSSGSVGIDAPHAAGGDGGGAPHASSFGGSAQQVSGAGSDAGHVDGRDPSSTAGATGGVAAAEIALADAAASGPVAPEDAALQGLASTLPQLGTLTGLLQQPGRQSAGGQSMSGPSTGTPSTGGQLEATQPRTGWPAGSQSAAGEWQPYVFVLEEQLRQQEAREQGQPGQWQEEVPPPTPLEQLAAWQAEQEQQQQQQQQQQKQLQQPYQPQQGLEQLPEPREQQDSQELQARRRQWAGAHSTVQGGAQADAEAAVRSPHAWEESVEELSGASELLLALSWRLERLARDFGPHEPSEPAEAALATAPSWGGSPPIPALRGTSSPGRAASSGGGAAAVVPPSTLVVLQQEWQEEAEERAWRRCNGRVIGVLRSSGQGTGLPEPPSPSGSSPMRRCWAMQQAAAAAGVPGSLDKLLLSASPPRHSYQGNA